MLSPLSETDHESEAVTFRGFKGPTKCRVKLGSNTGPSLAEIPKVDCTLISSPNLQHRVRIAQQVGKAFREVGFLYAVNHGISSALEEKVHHTIREFFNLPLEEKMKVHNSNSSVRRGYQYLLEGRGDDETRQGRLPLPPLQTLPAYWTNIF